MINIKPVRRLALILALVIASEVLARAGGGGSFSGGGGGGGFSGGGGSFGGGSGGRSGSGDWRVALAMIVLFIVISLIRHAYNSYNQRLIQRGARARNHINARKLVQQVAQHDPTFDLHRFYRRFDVAFRKIQGAWSAHDLRPVQMFISDGVLERFALQIREQHDLGYRDRIERIKINDIVLVQVVAGDVYESATVRFDVSMIDYRIGVRDGKYVSGSTKPASFVEYWTFLRRRGSASVTRAGLIEGNCPNCGGDVAMSQNAACHYCSALLRSGEHDWVLTEITQESVWQQRAQPGIPGFNPLREADPGLSIEALEDRASVLFWRRAHAMRLGDAAPLRKVAIGRYVEQASAYIEAERASRGFFGDIGVGSVEVQAILTDGQFDRALVEIAWSGTRFTQAPGRPPVRAMASSVIRTTLVLCRKSGVKSDPGKAIASLHCPTCGAPESDLAADACKQCGTVQNDPSLGWMLENVLASLSPEAQALLRSARDGATPIEVNGRKLAVPSSQALLAWVIKTSLADGQIDRAESKRIRRLAAKARLSELELTQLTEAGRSGELEPPEPADQAEARRWLSAMARAALSDGRLSAREHKLLKQTGSRIGLVGADIKLLLKRAQAQLYAEARDAIRESDGA